MPPVVLPYSVRYGITLVFLGASMFTGQSLVTNYYQPDLTIPKITPEQLEQRRKVTQKKPPATTTPDNQ